MDRANSSVAVQYSEKQSLASCIVSRQAGLTQGLEPSAVSVIYPPSGRMGRASSQSIAACCMDLRVEGLPLHLADSLNAFPVQSCLQGSNIWLTLFSGQ